MSPKQPPRRRAEPRIPVTHYIAPALYGRLRRYAAKRSTTGAAVVRQALAVFLDREGSRGGRS